VSEKGKTLLQELCMGRVPLEGIVLTEWGGEEKGMGVRDQVSVT